MNCDIHWYEETITSPRVEKLKEWGYTVKDGKHIIQRYTSGKDTAFDVFDIENPIEVLAHMILHLTCGYRLLYWVKNIILVG